MANILIYDTSTGLAKSYLESANTIEFTGRSDVIINPVLPEDIKDPSKLRVLDGVVRKRTKTQLEAQERAKYAASYMSLRAAAYPGLAHQVEAIMKQLKSMEAAGLTLVPEVTELHNKIEEVKALYPKPGSN